MPRYVAFLRAINVGRARTVKMETLRRIFESLGFTGVDSFISSGNIIFETPSRSTAALETRIEAGLVELLRYPATPFVRSGADLARIVSFKPFPRSTFAVGDQLAVVFLPAPPSVNAREALKAFRSDTDEFKLHGSEIYWLRHMNAEGAAYSTVPLDKSLEQPFTIRSMTTVRSITEKYFSHE